MTPDEIIHAAVPDASDDFCHHVLWGRTPFPCGVITAQSLYKAATSLNRANANGIHLCDHCHNLAMENEWMCKQCADALTLVR